MQGVRYGVLIVLVAGGAVAAMTGRTPQDQPAVKEFEITARQFEFEPATLEVAEGDTVRLKIRSADVAHGVEIKRFKVKKVVPKGGEIVELEFVADKSGTFDMVCTEYCGTGHGKMKAKLVVAAQSPK